MYHKIITSTFYSLFFCFQITVFAQDSLNAEAMKPYVYNFDINNRQLIGEGATILKKAVAEANVTLVGKSINSKLDVDFTKALFDILNSNDYQNMVLEIGGISGHKVNKLISKPEIKKQLTTINKKYTWEKNGSNMTPIPDLSYMESAELLEGISKENWSVFAVGIESWAAYKMLVDELFNNLPKDAREIHHSLYKTTMKVLDDSYKEVDAINIENLSKFLTAIKNAQSFVSFLNQMEEYEANKELVYHFRKSLDYWQFYADSNFFAKNVISIDESRVRLAKSLKASGIDFKKDKFFVKMAIVHLSKGIALNGFYGVGSMLSEMSKFHGNNSSVSIAVIPRYYKRDGVVEDYLESDLYFLGLFKEIIPLGKKDNWVLVDLRDFNEKFLYTTTVVSRELRKVIESYDFIVIPKTDGKPTPNY